MGSWIIASSIGSKGSLEVCQCRSRERTGKCDILLFSSPISFFNNQTLLGWCRPITTAIRGWFKRIESLQPNLFHVYIFIEQGLLVSCHLRESPMKQLFLSAPTFCALLSHSQDLPELAVPALPSATTLLALCWKQGQRWFTNSPSIKIVSKHLSLTVDPSTKKILEFNYLQKDLLGHHMISVVFWPWVLQDVCRADSTTAISGFRDVFMRWWGGLIVGVWEKPKSPV